MPPCCLLQDTAALAQRICNDQAGAAQELYTLFAAGGDSALKAAQAVKASKCDNTASTVLSSVSSGAQLDGS